MAKRVRKAALMATQPSFADKTDARPDQPAGGDAVLVQGGFVFNGERRTELQQGQKWVTFDNLVANFAIVASAIYAWTDLAGSAKWTVKPNLRGGKDAEKCAEIIRAGTIDATLSKPWRNVVKRQMMKKFRGFALHEVLVRRRSDGIVVLADLQHRPQWSVWRWDKPNPKQPWQGIEQRDRIGNTFPIPRDRLFYSVEDTLTDSPDGVGLLRYIVDAADTLMRYQELERIGFNTDLRGVPIARAPLSKLANQAPKGATAEQRKAFVASETKFLSDLLQGHVKTEDQSLLLDSTTYATLDTARTPSAIYEWSFDIVHGATTVMPEIGPAIQREIENIARMMSVEHMLVGSKGGSGTFGAHVDKTQMLGIRVNAGLDDIGDDATRDIATRLTVLNGYDPETCTPTMQAEPVATQSVLEACQALAAMAQAGSPIKPGWRGTNVLLSRMDLPDEPDPPLADQVAPRTKAQPPGAPAPTDGAKPGADAIGSVDQPPTKEAA